jgi:hypothetical protein
VTNHNSRGDMFHPIKSADIIIKEYDIDTSSKEEQIIILKVALDFIDDKVLPK